MNNLLILNCGSSSLKYTLFSGEQERAHGVFENIGQNSARVAHHWDNRSMQADLPGIDHPKAVESLSDHLREQGLATHLAAIGHRIVHGGEQFASPIRVTEDLLPRLCSLEPLAPLHNPPGIRGIELALRLWPGIPQIAVFDSAFHQTLPDYAYLYALPKCLYREHAIRRYGFHGQSHSYVSARVLQHMGRQPSFTRLISMHLGNGGSLCAIKDGKSIDTSMGMTPLEGLVMGTRCGDIDPALPAHIARVSGQSLQSVDDLLNRASGLLGLCGTNDMREILKRESDDQDARVALEIYIYRIKKYIGAYFAILGGLDALIFTGGIGEHAAPIRERICSGLPHLGIVIDPLRNDLASASDRAIHAADAPVQIWVIPSREAWEIACQCRALLTP